MNLAAQASLAGRAQPSQAHGSALTRLLWTWRRLRVMGAPEVAWRVRQALAARLEAAGLGRAGVVAPRGNTGNAWVAVLPRDFDPAPYREAADRVLAGRFDVFAMRDANLGFPPRWNVDPKTGTEAPAVFGKRIDYRDERHCGDIKYLWEPNRHLELVSLAQAWHLTGDEAYALGCRTLLNSWFDQCPYPLGPNWTSSLEHGIRLINWSVAWHLLGGEQSPIFAGQEGERFRQRWLQSIREHCHFIAGWLSRFSSANNHLLGETAGLYIGACTWPLWPESAGWRAMARATFEDESLRQTSPDGVNREQAIWYQHAVMELMLIAGLVGRANGEPFGRDFWDRLERMTDYLASLGDRAGHWPMLGDADDSTIVRWDPRAGSMPYRSLLISGVALFGRGDWRAQAGAIDDRARWLLGDAVAASFDSAPAMADRPRLRAFEEGGRYLLGARFGQPREVLATFDAGPLGYSEIAAHGHADALSLTLSAGGTELLIDPGTYAYHTEVRWRDYFRSTLAHNTIEVDGLDQSVSGGNFLWLDKARARCLSHSLDGPVQQVEAEHDGYARLDDPVMHRRRVSFEQASNRFVVQDNITCAQEHRLRLCWHLAEGCQPVVRADGMVVVNAPGVVMTFHVPAAQSAAQLLHGRDDPPAGWSSRAFDLKTPCHLLLWEFVIKGPVTLITAIDLGFEARTHEPAAATPAAETPA